MLKGLRKGLSRGAVLAEVAHLPGAADLLNEIEPEKPADPTRKGAGE
jgi:hypothetical protein